MKNDLLADFIKSESIVTNFFNSLLTTKRPEWKTATDKDRLIYLVKYYSAVSFFKLGNSYHLFISWVTQYYPFSLLYRDRLFHHDNLKIRNLMVRMEKLARKAGINILILSGNGGGNMTELIGYLDRKTKNRPSVLNALEGVLQKKYKTVYVRDGGEEVRILIPTVTFEGIINH